MDRRPSPFALFALAFLGFTGFASARENLPVQLAQAQTLPVLSNEKAFDLDWAVNRATDSNRRASPDTTASAVGDAVSAFLSANSAAIAAAPLLAISVAQEATKAAVNGAGMTGAKLIKVAAAIAAAAAKAVPEESASIFVAVVEALPAAEQTPQNEMVVAQAIDDAVPNAQITASLTPLGTSLATAQNTPPQFTTLTPLLTVLTNQAQVSPH